MTVPHLSEQLGDIQGMIGTGYGWLYNSRFWLLTIRDGRENDARKWLSDFVKRGFVVSAAAIRKSREKDNRIDQAVTIAFSYSGITKLGFRETEAHPFPSPFRGGMGSDLRALLLRDRYRQWRWSDDGTDSVPVHVLIAEWSKRDAKSAVSDIDEQVFGIIKIDNDPCAFRKVKGLEEERLQEAFGFRDGLAQPVIRGLRVDESAGLKQAIQDAGPLYDDRVVAPGEFILGYRNEYDELTYCPNLEGWTGDAKNAGRRFGFNGSYLAVRQIEQNVKAFETLKGKENGKKICEKLMGRQESGLPLSWKGPPNALVSDSEADAFRFRVDDANGFGCPKGAHIRRVNPRDSLGVDVKASIKSTKLHRLLRRGRPYLEKVEGDDPRKGIFFIACNADLERQFEFIHQRWVRNPNFGCLHDQDDPVVGSSSKFSIPGLASGEEMSLAAFTETLGGGYFFLPGIKALKFIVNHAPSPQAAVA